MQNLDHYKAGGNIFILLCPTLLW